MNQSRLANGPSERPLRVTSGQSGCRGERSARLRVLAATKCRCPYAHRAARLLRPGSPQGCRSLHAIGLAPRVTQFSSMASTTKQ